MVLRLTKQAVFFIPQLARALRFLFRNLSEFFVDGGISIDTESQPRDGEGSRKDILLFRTVIQPDGDILNLLRPPDWCKDDPNWHRLYEDTYRVHQAKLQDFLAGLDGLYTIPLVINMVLGFVLLVLPMRRLLLDEAKMITYAGLFVGWILLVSLFQKLLGRYFLKLIIRLLIKKAL